MDDESGYEAQPENDIDSEYEKLPFITCTDCRLYVGTRCRAAQEGKKVGRGLETSPLFQPNPEIKWQCVSFDPFPEPAAA